LGGEKFLAVLLGFHLATANWKSFQESLNKFAGDAAKNLKQSLKADTLDSGDEKLISLRTDFAIKCLRYNGHWHRVKIISGVLSGILFCAMCFNIFSPFWLLTGLPVLCLVSWRHVMLNRFKDDAKEAKHFFLAKEMVERDIDPLKKAFNELD
jgi:hypothetical protein